MTHINVVSQSSAVQDAVLVLILVDHLLKEVKRKDIFGDCEEGNKVASIRGHYYDAGHPVESSEEPSRLRVWQMATSC